MASNLPVISTKCGGPEDIIENWKLISNRKRKYRRFEKYYNWFYNLKNN